MEINDLMEAIEYAVEHKLFRDYNTGLFSSQSGHIDRLNTILPDEFDDSSDLPVLTSPISPPTREAFGEDDSHAITLLQDVLRILPDADAKALAEASCRARSAKSIRMPIPLLRSDHEMDLRQFASNIKESLPAGRALLLTSRLPMDPFDEDKDEGMEFPALAVAFAYVYNEDLELESPDFSNVNVNLFVDQALAVDVTESDRNEFMGEKMPIPVCLLSLPLCKCSS
jgi:hypothetical protein